MTHAELLKRLQSVTSWFSGGNEESAHDELKDILSSVATLIEQHGKMMEFIQKISNDRDDCVSPGYIKKARELLEDLNKC